MSAPITGRRKRKYEGRSSPEANGSERQNAAEQAGDVRMGHISPILQIFSAIPPFTTSNKSAENPLEPIIFSQNPNPDQNRLFLAQIPLYILAICQQKNSSNCFRPFFNDLK